MVAVASYVSHVSLFARFNLLELLPCKFISSFALEFLRELWPYYIIDHKPHVLFLYKTNLFAFSLTCSTEPSRSGVGPFLLDFTKPSASTCATHVVSLCIGTFCCDFTRALFLPTCATKSRCWDLLCLVLLF